MSSAKPPGQNQQQKAETQAQADLLNQQREMLQKQYDQNQLLAPIIYKQNNIEPQYNDKGEVIGYRDLGPTKEQQAYGDLLNLQTQNAKYASALTPLQLQQQGYKVTTDANGMPTNLEVIPGGPADQAAQAAKQQGEVNSLLLDRTKKALNGELTIDPGLEKQLATSEEALRSHLRQNLGSGYETSTPGIQALAENKARADALRYGAAHGEIGYADQLALAGQQNINPYATVQASGASSQYLQPFATQGNPNARSQQMLSAIGAPFSTGNSFGTLAEMYGNAGNQLFNQSMSNWQAGRQAQAQNRQQNAMYGSLAGGIIGGAIGAIPTLGIGAPAGAAIGAGIGGAAGGSFS